MRGITENVLKCCILRKYWEYAKKSWNLQKVQIYAKSREISKMCGISSIFHCVLNVFRACTISWKFLDKNTTISKNVGNKFLCFHGVEFVFLKFVRRSEGIFTKIYLKHAKCEKHLKTQWNIDEIPHIFAVSRF